MIVNKTGKTKINWAKVGYVPKSDATGEERWTNGFHSISAVFYDIDEVELNKDRADAFILAEKKTSNERRREKARREKAIRDNLPVNVIKKKIKTTSKETVRSPLVAKTIIFDVETTGTDPETNEIIQLSIIDDQENVLFNSYVRPYVKTSWPDAQRINGISPDMVQEAPYPHEIAPLIRDIFNQAELLIGYNNSFDLSFLVLWGINAADKKQVDVMLNFSEIYGDYSEYFGNYKWQKLTTAAKYYGYEFSAHDALEDVKAPLFVYKKICSQDRKRGMNNDDQRIG